MPESVLVANRGEIALRVIRTARRMGIRAIAVYSEADAMLPFVAAADEAVLIGAAAPAASYLNADAVLAAAAATGARSVHPGYGFLAENAGFAGAVIEAGLTWVGPPPAAIEQMGDKISARNLMEAAGVPVSPGSRVAVPDVPAALAEARRIGYPVMIKAAAGGGGIGMTAAGGPAELGAGFETARSRAERFFGSPAILLERFLAAARHVEVQILGLADGRVVALGERDCSVQRRHQKVAEETPSPGVGPGLRARMLAAAVRAGEAVGYRGAGTVEFLVDEAAREFVFLEMNTRLQVEHPITELVTGLDLVEQQFRIADGETGTLPAPPATGQPAPDQPGPGSDGGPGPGSGAGESGSGSGLSSGGAGPGQPAVPVSGHAIELRVYAEDPRRFLPSPGTITEWSEPSGPGVRVDAGYALGNTVTPFYDPLLAKLCVHGADRDQALDRARAAVAGFTITGLKTNLPFHAELLASAEFTSGAYDTTIIDRLRAAP